MFLICIEFIPLPTTVSGFIGVDNGGQMVEYGYNLVNNGENL